MILYSKIVECLTTLESNTLNRFQRLNRVELISSYIEDLRRENKKMKEEISDLRLSLRSREADLNFLIDEYEMLHSEFDKRVKEIKYGKN